VERTATLVAERPSAIARNGAAPAAPAAGSTIDDPYTRIKTLENSGQLVLPQTKQTVSAGTYDAQARRFTYRVPTGKVEEILGIGPHPRPIFLAVGVVAANAVDLSLQFGIVHAAGPITAQVFDHTGKLVGTGTGQTSIVVDVGPAESTLTTPDDPRLEPGQLAPFSVSFSGPGGQSGSVLFQIVRLPLVGGGAFTIPVLPVSIVYAPPAGSQGKNYAECSILSSSSLRISTTVNSSRSSKTMTAYSPLDFAQKIAGVAAQVATLLGPAAVAVAAAVKQGLDELAAVIPTETTTDSVAVSAGSDHALQFTDTSSWSYATPSGLGPGHGDRHVFLTNVQCAWLIADGELSYTVLGYEGVVAVTADDLVSDHQAILAGGATGPITDLDRASVELLLGLDPFIASPTLPPTGPRFTRNEPASVSGKGTGSGGDTLSASHDVTATDSTTKQTTNMQITNVRPGWLTALFNGDQTHETQLTQTYSAATQTTGDHKITSTVHLYAGVTDPPYAVDLYFDEMFQTLAFVAKKH
jgi:hypothetical protein